MGYFRVIVALSCLLVAAPALAEWDQHRADTLVGIVPAERGGTGENNSASTGVCTWEAGAYVVAATLTAARGGTGSDNSAATGVCTWESGTYVVENPLGAAKGGTGLDTSAATGIPSVSSGSWSVETGTKTVKTFSATCDPGTAGVAANACANCTVTGIVLNRAVVCNPRSDPADTDCTLSYCRASGTNTVRICIASVDTVNACTWGSGTWDFEQPAD